MPLIIFADGSAFLHSKLGGGWAAAGFSEADRDFSTPLWQVGGDMIETDSGRAELMALIGAAHQVPTGAQATICGDCLSVLKVADRIVRPEGSSVGLPQRNRDLWERLREELHGKLIQFKWVRGHAGHPAHSLVHRLSREYARNG